VGSLDRLAQERTDLASAEVSISRRGEDGSSTSIDLPRTAPGLHAASWIPDAPGEHLVEVSEPGLLRLGGRAGVVVEVTRADAEWRRPDADHALLASIAEATGGAPKAILIATGSEVGLCMTAREALEKGGIPTRGVSMPCTALFDRQDAAYRESVLPRSVKVRVSVEEASTLGWHRYVGDGGAVIGMHTFGASAPIKDLMKKFGFEPQAIVDVTKRLLQGG